MEVIIILFVLAAFAWSIYLAISLPLLGIPLIFAIIIGIICFFNWTTARVKNIEKENAKTRNKLQEKLLISGFNIKDLTYNNLGLEGIVLNKKSNKIALIKIRSNGNFNLKEINYDDILRVEIVEDGVSVTQTSRRGQIGGALLGGVLAGGVGAIIGGLSSEKRNVDKVKNIQLQIIINNTNQPIQKINFLDSDDYIPKSDDEYKRYYKKAQHWYNSIEVLIHKADKESNDVRSLSNNNIDNFNKTSISVADELKKLNELKKDGVLSVEEFESQKKKLLS